MKIIMRVLGKPGRQYDEIEFDTDRLPFTYEAENGKVRISRASKTEESPGTVPAVAAANNRSDEIAWLEGTLKDCDGYFSSSDDYVFIKTRINERIAQLRAMR